MGFWYRGHTIFTVYLYFFEWWM